MRALQRAFSIGKTRPVVSKGERKWALVDDYLGDLLAPSDPVLEAAIESSNAAGLPPISVSPSQGKLLALLAKAIGARAILEIGTLGGYSTIWLARALAPDGRLITLERDPARVEVARTNIARAQLSDRVEQRCGNALDLLPDLSGPYDLIFIDADPINLAAYFRWAVKLSRRGSLILVDNVVRHGSIVDTEARKPAIQALRRFFEYAASEPSVSMTAIQTVGRKGYDGFAVGLVLAEAEATS